MVSASERLRPRTSPRRPKNAPHTAQPTRNDPWIRAILWLASSSSFDLLSSCRTRGVATSVYRCMSSPSNSQPSHAAMPLRHCAELRLRRPVAVGSAYGAWIPRTDGASALPGSTSLETWLPFGTTAVDDWSIAPLHVRQRELSRERLANLPERRGRGQFSLPHDGGADCIP